MPTLAEQVETNTKDIESVTDAMVVGFSQVAGELQDIKTIVSEQPSTAHLAEMMPASEWKGSGYAEILAASKEVALSKNAGLFIVLLIVVAAGLSGVGITYKDLVVGAMASEPVTQAQGHEMVTAENEDTDHATSP